MDLKQIKGRFHIYTGYREGQNLKHIQQAGEAYSVEGTSKPFYIVKMWAHPRDVFYLANNMNEDGTYTLFAKKIGEENNPIFRRPVGFGFLSPDLKQHLEIQFTFPRQRVFMSLFPDRVTIDSLIGENGGLVHDEVISCL